MKIYPVIMCGGAGSRLWPASRPGRPKQFLPLTGARSLFQETVLRVAPLAADGDVVVVAGLGHADAISAELAAIGVEATILLEPEARDSGPAMAAAAAFIQRRDPDGVAAIIASDHHIPDAEAFRAAVRVAADEAARGRIVTLGVTPTWPSPAYGYISPEGVGLSPVKRFVEKPDAATAARYLADGFLWNSGNFIVSAAALMDELTRHAPGIADAARDALPADLGGPLVRLTDAFRAAPRISIDYAVMEKSDRTSVLPVGFEWSDVGAWDSVLATGAGHTGLHIGIDSPNVLVRAADGMVVATLGVSNIAVIAESDAVLVCDLSRAQDVKVLVDRVKAEAPRHADVPDAADATPYQRFGDWMRTAALPLWATLGTHADGAFVEALTLEGRAIESRRRARVQTRQIYVFARAGALGWAGPWRQRVEQGLDRFLAGYVRPDGAVRNALNTDGSVQDDAVLLYEQAFTLLALSAAHAAGIETARCEAQATIMLERLLADRLAGGGWREDGEHPFQANAGRRSALGRGHGLSGGPGPDPFHRRGWRLPARELRRRLASRARRGRASGRARPPVRVVLAIVAPRPRSGRQSRHGRVEASVPAWPARHRPAPGRGGGRTGRQPVDPQRPRPPVAPDRVAARRPGHGGPGPGLGTRTETGRGPQGGDRAAPLSSAQRDLAGQAGGLRRLYRRTGPGQFALPHHRRLRSGVRRRRNRHHHRRSNRIELKTLFRVRGPTAGAALHPLFSRERLFVERRRSLMRPM